MLITNIPVLLWTVVISATYNIALIGLFYDINTDNFKE
jgi:hypothetical protein